MKQLSPAAQAVLDAMHRSYDHEPTRRAIAAAVLRAAAAQVIRREAKAAPPTDWGKGCKQGSLDTAAGLLAIAAELEGQADG